MAIKIGINGFGRIGRIVLRILCEDPEAFDVRGINLRKADIDYMVYLLKYDSVFRNFPGMVEHAGGDLVVNGHKIKVFSTSSSPPVPTTPPRRPAATSRAAPRRSSSPPPQRTTPPPPSSTASTATSTVPT